MVALQTEMKIITLSLHYPCSHRCSRRSNGVLARMKKKLAITIDKKVYESLSRVVGAGRICEFIEQLVGPHVLPDQLDAAYADMAADQKREEEALAWSEVLIADGDDEAR